ncbi:MAG: Eco57I restriction-modification methylase domain-containing protein [Candidatus Saccharimonadaceae bacterium]
MVNKETAYAKISDLVDRFDEHFGSYTNSAYNETLTRRDFIDPFFKTLGWDIDNEQGYAEAYREVIHEDKVKVGGATKAPDYSFRIGGGKRLFFVEAKKPSIAIKNDILPAYQVRRYGWSAKLPISIITDFEEFAIYDCTKKPELADKASVARIKYLTYKDYLAEFDFIWDTFSKEKVLKGSFDKFVLGSANKKGTATVDKEFLLSLDKWRTYLATSISWNNKNLDEDEINFVVQQTIDRLIFLRIAEDRSIEPYANLQNALKQGNYYQNLFSIFRDADDKYNSGLFDLKKDKYSKDVHIDNKVIKTIINEMYYPECPYEFSVLPVEILGSAYEQFLGKVIRITPAHHAKIEEKPEVRKAGGVYYTPQYVVEYIVKNTVGKLVEGKTPKEVSVLKIVDPACGSGSFLIGAYQYLLDWHKNYYSGNGKLTKGSKATLTIEGNLTTAEKKRILLNNIYGVDIDVNAVEVTKLSLLLKCLEGETSASIAHQLSMFNERVLPTLENNIKSGNSLIDIDFYASHIDFGEEKKIKPFSWQKNFIEVFNQGGFDAVIGNPPYVLLQNLEKREVFDYTSQKFQSAKYKIDTYQLFIEQSIILLKTGGLLGFITPNTFLKNIHAEPLRKYIFKNTIIKEILLLGYSVFSAASVDTCVFIFNKGIPTNKSELFFNKADVAFEVKHISMIKQFTFSDNNRMDFNFHVSENDSKILNKIERNTIPISNFCGAYFGIQTFDRNKFVSKEKLNENYVPIIDGANIEPYKLKPPKEFVNYIPSSIKSGGNETIYRQDRICIRQIGAFPIATFVPANIFTLNTIYNVYLKENIIVSLKYFLGVMNSKATEFFWKKNNSDEKKTFPKVKKEAILSIPIPIISKYNTQYYDEIVKLVDHILQLNQEKSETNLQTKITQLESKIDYCENRINEIVYQLYDLTPDEIKIVEDKI